MSTYYIDPNGNDAASGLSGFTPWRTLSQHNAATIAAGSAVLLKSSGVWRETLLPKPGVSYGAYGGISLYGGAGQVVVHGGRSYWNDAGVPIVMSMPVISGSDVVAGWTLDSVSHAWRVSLAYAPAKVFIDANFQQSSPLTPVASVALVGSTGGSMFYDATAKLLYIMPPDGTDPRMHLVEVSGSRSYGINCTVANVSIDGLAVIHCASSGDLINGVVDNNVRKNMVYFNNANPNLVGDSVQGFAFGHVWACAGFGAQTMVPGLVISSCQFGALDWAHSTAAASHNNYGVCGLFIAGFVSPKVQACKIATVSGWALRVGDWYSQYNNFSNKTLFSTSGATIDDCFFTNCEGNLLISGAPNTSVSNSQMVRTFGSAIQTGCGTVNGLNASTGFMYFGIRAEDIQGCYPNASNDPQEYNGFDTNNNSAGGTIARCVVRRVQHSCVTLEGDLAYSGDPAPGCSGTTLYSNTLDASQNYGPNGTLAGSSQTAFALYMRDVSMSGLAMRNNDFLPNVATGSVARLNASSASDTSGNVATVAALRTTYPNA